MRITNKRIYSGDQEKLKALQEEYEQYCGFLTELEPGVLTVLCSRKRPKPKAPKEKSERNKRSEKFERRS